MDHKKNFYDADVAPVPKKTFYSAVKRLFDIVFSFLLLIVLSPLFLILALIIRICDGGPAFYVSTRLTTGGRPFKMYKFRSMRINADRELENLKDQNEMNDGPAFKMSDDPRVTKFGHFLRRSSLDELPQLWNVFIGDMSFVGPRPPLPEEVRRYTVYQKQRLAVKQGLTCYWQCSGRNDIGFAEWVELDLKYIRERSLLTDLKILFRTVGAVITMRGAK